MRPGDSAIGRLLFCEGDFEYQQFSDALSLVRRHTNPRVFVDVGANIGTHTIYALNSGVFERAVCFEPNPDNFRLLQVNVEENGYTSRCTLYRVALSDRPGTLEMELDAHNDGDHRIRHDNAVTPKFNECDRERITVEAATLDSALAGIDPESCFLHMDVQGYEAYALKGAKKFLERTQAVFMEFWPYGLDRTNSLQDCISIVRDRFREFVDVTHAPEVVRSTHEIDADFVARNYDAGADLVLIR